MNPFLNTGISSVCNNNTAHMVTIHNILGPNSLQLFQFAKKVPVFEQTVALKLSCVGRDQKHALEQDYFRAAFPHTPLIGCYGNGELGISHPPRPQPADPPRSVKRHRRNPRQQGIMYSYSTVFVYVGWGKIMSADN